VATKSGTNTFHGEGAMLFTNAGLNSLGRGLWQNNPTNLGIPEFYRAREDEYRTFYPGFQLGGPLIRDRLHFFTSYFPEANRTERTVTHLSDKSTRTYTTRVLRHYGMSRLDYAPSQKIQINTSYMWNPLRAAGVLPSTDGRIAPPSNDLSIQGGYTPSNAYTAALNYIPTPKLILSARYGKKYLNDKGNAYGKSGLPWITYSSPTSAQTTPPVPADFAGANGFQNVTSTFLVLKDITTRHNVYADASYITRLFGQQHNFKFGYQINRMANDVQDDFLNGRILINWGEGYTRGQFNNVRGTYGYYT